ncbi:MAG: esterase-like activity of phytase family protein [Pseudomonadota bacterium]
MRARPVAGTVAISLCIAAQAPIYANELVKPVSITARPIANFLIGSDQQKFGPLTFLGGLEMESREQHFGAISGVDFSGEAIWLVTDTGFWLQGSLNRNENGAPEAITATSIGEITAKGGARFSNKWEADAEGIAIAQDGTVVISFERDHRIAQYQWDGANLRFVEDEQPPVPLYELRQNRGFEGVAVAPENFAYPQAIVGLSEKSLDKQRNIMGFVNPPGPSNAFEFSLLRTDNFDVTDIAFLPTGDLLVLERRFNLSQGIAMRIRQIDGDQLTERSTVDGKTLLEADMSYQIDNMEGLAITPLGDDQVRLTLVSDDNKSLLQRNLLLEFALDLN